MQQRPIPVTVISIVLVVTGVLGVGAHLWQSWTEHRFESDVVWTCLVSLLALIAGVYMLRASNWARWLSLAWIAFHVVLSFFHSPFQVAVHLLVFAAFAWFLFRPRANAYFRAEKA